MDSRILHDFNISSTANWRKNDNPY